MKMLIDLVMDGADETLKKTQKEYIEYVMEQLDSTAINCSVLWLGEQENKVVKNLPIIGETYLLAYKGIYDYDGYIGEGIYTGKIDDSEETVYYEFKIGKDFGFFPLSSVYPLVESLG